LVIFRTTAKISQIYCWGILIWATLYYKVGTMYRLAAALNVSRYFLLL